MTAAALASALVPPPVLALAVKASVIARGDRRLEAENYLSDGYVLRQRIESIPGECLERRARVWQPTRLKGIQVSPGKGTPFLAATQVFDVRPVPRKWLALPRTPNADERFVKPNWILVTCSGSVGDTILAYRPLRDLMISHDLLRVVPFAKEDQGYLYAYLRTTYARGMMRSTKYGNVIKHLEPEHLQAIPVPEIGDNIKAIINSAVTRCFALRDEAFELARGAEAVYSEAVGRVNISAVEQGFSIKARQIGRGSRRLDAYSYNPLAAAVVEAINKTKKPIEPLSNLAERIFMPNRFVRTAFLDAGVPLIGSEELFTVNPEIDKFLPQSVATPELFVDRGWLLMARSGQIYGINGQLALATAWHEHKIITEDAIRIVPKNIRPGYLLVALGHPTLGRPLVLLATFGTSIPHVDPDWLGDVPVIRLGPLEETIADKAERAVALRTCADEIENAATAIVEGIISRALGDGTEDAIDAALARLRLAEIEGKPEAVLQGAALEKRLKRWQS